MHRIAIFGGTFDPIHNGHLQTSNAIQSSFKFDSYLFLPCKIPALKPSSLANAQQRIKMIELALKNHPDFAVDLREILRESPSYMFETLKSLRHEFPHSAITLIIGYDAFLSLNQWYQWQELITLANILVINRNRFNAEKVPETIQLFMNKYQTQNKTAIQTQKAGALFLFDAGDYDISSTAIRQAIKNKKKTSSQLPDEVSQYIKDEGLYQ